VAGQQIDHHARMRRIEMLDQDEGHAGPGRERGQQSAESIEPAGRSAKPDDRETFSRKRRAAPRRRTPVRPWASRSGSLRSPPCHHSLISLGGSRCRQRNQRDDPPTRAYITALLIQNPRQTRYGARFFMASILLANRLLERVSIYPRANIQ